MGSPSPPPLPPCQGPQVVPYCNLMASMTIPDLWQYGLWSFQRNYWRAVRKCQNLTFKVTCGIHSSQFSGEDEFDDMLKANPIWRRNFGVIMSSTLPNEAIGNMGDNIPGEIFSNDFF